jgi:hypothetical protein
MEEWKNPWFEMLTCWVSRDDHVIMIWREFSEIRNKQVNFVV